MSEMMRMQKMGTRCCSIRIPKTQVSGTFSIVELSILFYELSPQLIRSFRRPTTGSLSRFKVSVGIHDRDRRREILLSEVPSRRFHKYTPKTQHGVQGSSAGSHHLWVTGIIDSPMEMILLYLAERPGEESAH